jgi:hypothetical protein
MAANFTAIKDLGPLGIGLTAFAAFLAVVFLKVLSHQSPRTTTHTADDDNQTLYTGLTNPLRKVPGPWYALFTNQILKNAVTGGRRIFYIDSLHQKYGPVVRISPTEVAVSDIDGFKQIHAVSSKFTKDIWYEKLTNFPRHSVFTLRDPKKHAQRRKLFARGFSKSYLREHWGNAVSEKCKLAVWKIRQDAKAGNADLLKWWTFMATDIVGLLGFGESFGMLELGRVGCDVLCY